MNNTNAIALIETGVLPVEKMLNLCMRASRNDPRGHLDVIQAFVNVWLASDPYHPTSGGKQLIDVVAGLYGAEEGVIRILSKEWDREHFDYAFQKLSDRMLLLFMAASSGKYNQQEVFEFAREYQGYYSPDHMPHFWAPVVSADILDAEGLFRVAMLDTKQFAEMLKLCLHIISKNLLSASQLWDLCIKFENHVKVDFAAIATGMLSDDQIVNLMINGVHDWKNLHQHLRLQDWSVERLITLGQKPQSGSLWQLLSEVIKKKIATGELSDDELIAIMSIRDLRCEWADAVPYLRLQDRTTEELIAFGEKVDSDMLWPAIIAAINSKKG